MSEFLVIAGLSGAGRSQAADSFEDLGWFVIDNLPAPLMPKVVELADSPGSTIERVALVTGAGHHDADMADSISRLRNIVPTLRVLFLDASTPELVRRYEQTRRRHPIESDSVSTSIELERSSLETVRGMADLTIDTTNLNVHQLRDRIRGSFAAPLEDHGMQTVVRSFGFKHGLPLDADLVFDVRFLPNPHWIDELRPLTGIDEPVRDHVLSQRQSEEFLRRLLDLFELLIPAYRDEGKAHLTIAVGCTGGHHRAVAISEELGRRLGNQGTPVRVSHRDIER